MSCGNTYNQTSLDIANAQYNQRFNSPSVGEKNQWHKEFLESGAQYKMSYAFFLKQKTKLWQIQKEQSNWTFGGGKYHGQKIKDIIKADINWINWVLTNSPKGKLSRQIVLFCRNNLITLESIETNSYLKNLPAPKTKKTKK